MYELVVMPLTEFWDLGADDPAELQEALGALQGALSEQVGAPVKWEEKPTQETYESDSLDPFCVHALRALAAWVDVHGDVEGFEIGETPWEHDVYGALDEEEGAKKFPHLVHTEADVAVFAPVDLPGVYFMGPDDEDEAAEEEEDDEPEELAVGSLPRLAAELDALNVHLKLAGDIDELPDDVVFDSDADPLAAPKYAWAVIRAAVKRATAETLPLIMYFDASMYSDDEETHDHEE